MDMKAAKGTTSPASASQADAGTRRLLSVSGVSKAFGTTKAVQGVDFWVGSSEIVGLLGGNGAGKSTLVRIIGGLIDRDEGEMFLLDRNIVSRHTPEMAMSLGLRFVHQELSLCSNLKVLENFALELPDLLGGLQWKKKAAEFTRSALDAIFPGNRIDPYATVSALSLSQKQMVEIARALSHPSTRLVVLDEPTSSLGSREAEQLRDFMKRRCKEGMSFIFITHRLNEVLDVASRIAVMRNGQMEWTGKTEGVDINRLVELLGGKLAGEAAARSDQTAASAADALKICGLTTGILRGIDLTAQKGEIIGLAGLEGSGQRVVLKAIFEDARLHGSKVITISGKPAFVSGDRANEGVFPLWSINRNIAASSFSRYSKWGLLSTGGLGELTRKWFERLSVRAESGEDPVVSLSGGNQQKIVIARALASDADIVLLDDPTRGVDLGTKAELYKLFRELAAQGKTLIWYSTEDAEFAECDRTLVMRDGGVVESLSDEEFSVERLVEASFRKVESGEVVSRAQARAERARQRELLVSAMIPLVTFGAVFLICVSMNPRILSPFGLTLVFSSAFALAFAAISQLFIIAAGDIDLGVGTFIGLVNVIAATWLVSDPPLAMLCFAGLLLAYPAMGLFIEARRLPAIIVTLGLSFVWLGLAALRLPRAGGSAPEWLVDLLRIKLPLLPVPVLLCIFPAVCAYLVLVVWRYGAVLRGFGANPRAIAAAGWSTRKAKATLYGFGGGFAFLAGILVTASTRGGDPTGSSSMTLLSVAAVILGGAAFTGGIVAPIGALFGTLTLVLVGTLLSLLGVNAVYLPMVQGLLLLGAVGVRTVLLGRTGS